MGLSTDKPLPVEYALDAKYWPKARSYFIKAVGPYTSVALVMPIHICDSSGAAHVLEHLLFRGSARFPDRNLLLETRRNLSCLDINAATHEDHMVLHATSANRDDLLQVFDAYFDAIQQPMLEQRHFDQEREIVFNEISTLAKNSHHDGSINVGGEPELLKQLTHQSLLSFWQHQCYPDEFVVIVVGEEPLGLSYPPPDRSGIEAPVYASLSSAQQASNSTLLSLGKIQCADRQLDALMVQCIAEPLGWVHKQSLADFTLWHADHAAIDPLRDQIARAEEIPQFDRLLQNIAQQALYPGSAKRHCTVQQANTFAAAVIRGADIESIFTQRAESIEFLAHWRDREWRIVFALELGSNNYSENGAGFTPVTKRASTACTISAKSSKAAIPSPVGDWLTINGVSVWVHAGEAVHWTLRYDGLQVSKLSGSNHSTVKNFNLVCFNQAGNVIGQNTTSSEFSSCDAFLAALRDGLMPAETNLTLKPLSPAIVTVLNEGSPFQIKGQSFNCLQRPNLHHLSIPGYFLDAFRESGIKNEDKDLIPNFKQIYQAEHQNVHQSGSAVILIPVKPAPDAQQEAMLHLFAAYLEITHIMPNVREACGAYGGSARYLPHLNALVLQSYGDPQPKQSGDLLLHWFGQCRSHAFTQEDLRIAKNVVFSLLQIRGKLSLWYQLGEVVTAPRWQQTQVVWHAVFKAEALDIGNLIL